MSRSRVLIDTDVLSAIQRSDPQAMSRLAEYISLFGRATWSVITSYEVLRGLRWKRATGQELAFRRICDGHEVLPLTAEIADVAAQLHADCKSRGIAAGDADTLIAATALVYGMSVATGNVRHFREFSSLHLENWLVH
ncbi:MAG: VapC toxin family PIN domain ribonuclease [Planctomycetota bacterium]|nr:MAG: VapC toxin family PIN domain ribonuclease [Planctomycetota bacterium]